MPHQPVPQTMNDDGTAGTSSTPKTPISIDETGDDNPAGLMPSKGVVFIRTVSPDFTASGAFIGAGTFGDFAGPFAPLTNLSVQGPVSDLFIADVASGTVTLLGHIHPDGTYTADPSHPAFYLPGQEFGAGNHRAFAALDFCAYVPVL